MDPQKQANSSIHVDDFFKIGTFTSAPAEAIPGSPRGRPGAAPGSPRGRPGAGVGGLGWNELLEVFRYYSEALGFQFQQCPCEFAHFQPK